MLLKIRLLSQGEAMSPINRNFRAKKANVQKKAFVYYQRLRNLSDFIENHLEDKLGIEQAARIACLEKKYFSAYFRKKVGIRYSTWINLLKIERAKSLLGSEDYQISEVSHILGYDSLSTFERRFREFTKLTPSQFKKSIKKSFYIS
jgi:AraC-like DNA-binding protein